jgi:hypothetical protein
MNGKRVMFFTGCRTIMGRLLRLVHLLNPLSIFIFAYLINNHYFTKD